MKTTLRFVLAFVAWSATAGAEPHAATAEALFRQGRELMTKGRYAEACAAFDASQKQDPATTTLFNQADCREKNGQLATAWGLFVDAERQTRGSTDDVGTKLHTVALARANKLEPRLSKVTIKVKTPIDGLAVFRNDESIDRGTWDRALPTDGGNYTFTARIAGKEVWSEVVTVANEGAEQTIEVAIQPAQQRAPTPEPVALTPTKPKPSPSEPRHSHTGAILTTATAVVLLGGAFGFSEWGDSTYHDAVAQHSMDLWSSANNERYAAEGLLAAGVAAGGIATWLWLRGDGGHTSTATAIAPIATPGFAGVSLAHRW
jgi:hypothetical protein